MPVSDLYDRDFVLWTETQAAELRRMAAGSNSLDIPHLAEEIEDLGKRDIREVESFLRQILEHLLKVVGAPQSGSVAHWRAEIVTFQQDAATAFTNSMRHKIGCDQLWRDAVERYIQRSSPDHERIERLRNAQTSPMTLDDLVTGFDLDRAVIVVDRVYNPAPPPS